MSIAMLSRSIAGVTFVVASAMPAAGQNMTLNVPFRGPAAMQTASTVVEFDPTTLAGGASISVDGTSVPVPASPCAGAACNAADLTGAGDDILVTRVTGTNRVRLTLTYLGSFGANFCSPNPGLGNRSFNVVLTGFTFTNPANGYRITSFMAPSNASCDIPYVRVPSVRPQFTAGAPARLGRLPLNLVLVLDKSPSMAWTIAGGATADPNQSRFARLTAAVTQLVAAWDVVGAPPPPTTVSSEGHPEDRLGLIFFGGTASESPLGPGTFFKERGNASNPWLAGVTAALTGGFIGGTSLGAGTANARLRLNEVDALIGDTATILFSDGEQNTPPCIVRQGEVPTPTVRPYPNQPPGTTYTDNCFIAAAQPPANLLTLNGSVLAQTAPRGPVYTIGLGEGGVAAAAVLLDEISQETAARPWFPLNGPALDTAFADSLIENLKGGTVSMLDRTFGSLAAGTGQGAPMAVEIDPSLTRVMFVAGWEGVAREMQIEIRDPNGTVVSAPLTAQTISSRVAAVNLPANGPSGTWQVRLVRLGGPNVVAKSGALNYHLSAYGVESRLSSRVSESPRLTTGSPIRVVAEVGWSDGGLDNLPAGAIRATIERPSGNLGTILHDATNVQTGKVRDDTSPLMMKFDQLARTTNLLARITPSVGETITLTHVGLGRYEGEFTSTDVGGPYRIRVDFDWDDPRTERIKRTQSAERQVAVLPSAEASTVVVRRDGANATIVITPRDRFGNYVGPGFENQFNVQVNGVRAAILDPSVTGNYTINLTGLAPGDDPRVTIVYGGETLRDTTLSQIVTGGRRAVWAALGRTWPHDLLDVVFDSDMALNFGYEQGLRSMLAFEATYGRHQFSTAVPDFDLTVTQLGVNLKAYLASGRARPFVLGGAGIYTFDPGDSEAGVYLGGGVQVPVRSNIAIEGRYMFHYVFADEPRPRYSTLQAGVRLGF